MTYLDRYRRGECETVWSELRSLGDAIREEPLYADALAVARETMGRVRLNVERIIGRLDTMGYHFLGVGDAQFDPEAAAADVRLVPVFLPPSANVQELLTEMERIGGLLPVSLRAFYEIVGTINLIGVLPAWERLKPAGIADVATFMRKHPTFDWSNYSLDHGLDPLFVWPIEVSLLMVQELTAMEGATESDSNPATEVYLAPDHYAKFGLGVAGPYKISIPQSAIDAPLENEWHGTDFVDYLRIALRWGGMPGLERAHVPPFEDVARLTKDLKPI